MKYSILAIAIAALLVLLLSFTRKHRAKNKADAVLSYLKENPDKSSIKLVRNGEILADINSAMIMPLASTVKIIVAIEYAEQVAAGLLDPEELISFDQLDQFYIPRTDGGAHMAWFKSIKNEIMDDGIPLRDVARGMILYSSNANTEWLCARLGFDNINERLEKLGIKDHSEIYPIVSALFVGRDLFPELKLQELADAIDALSMEDYHKAIYEIHEKLKVDTTYKNDVGSLNLAVQKVWSDRLPASTTAEYTALLQKLNSREYFSEEVHKQLTYVLEVLMENPGNQSWLQHAGMKGGSTAFVLTKATYSTDKDGNTTELAYFFNDVGLLEMGKLQRGMNEFELKLMQDEVFRLKVSSELGQ